MVGTTDTKKVISVEAIGLFADTEKKNMSSLQLSMCNHIINHIHSNKCTPHDLYNIIEGYYGQEVRNHNHPSKGWFALGL